MKTRDLKNFKKLSRKFQNRNFDIFKVQFFKKIFGYFLTIFWQKTISPFFDGFLDIIFERKKDHLKFSIVLQLHLNQ